MIQRGGDVRFKMLDRITAKSLAKAIAENVEAQARLITDELPLYGPVGRAFEGGHEMVKHSAREYPKACSRSSSAV